MLSSEEQGIIDFGEHPLSNCAANLLHRLLGAAAKEGGKILELWLRQYRENLENVSAARQRMGEERHLQDETLRSVDPKVGALWLLGACLESEETLRELWARLLTNAEDPNFKEEVRIAFFDIIKALSPLDVRIIEWVRPQEVFPLPVTEEERHQIVEALKSEWDEIQVGIDNLKRLQLLANPSAADSPIVGETSPRLTALGRAFLRACAADNVPTTEA